jgi:D-alanyl-D-alanine carboxypeptidase
METFFAVLASMSLVFTWTSATKLQSIQYEDACAGTAAYQMVATKNAATLQTAAIAPFGRSETGWKLYAPQIAQTIGSPCTPETEGFAVTLAAWQAQHRLSPTGEMNVATLSVMKNTWQQARPFVAAFDTSDCPPAPAEHTLATIGAKEGWVGKISKIDSDAVTNLRAMVAAARAEDPRIAADPAMLTIVSAFRSPEYDAQRCATQGNCNGIARARCSAHRTGKALDLFIGALPGHSPVSTDDANRLYQTQTPAYQWLVKNAARFGFVNYVFEPWHWEWVGRRAPETQAPVLREARLFGGPQPKHTPLVQIRSAMLHLRARMQTLTGTN